MASYATVVDYELRTGVDVPVGMEETVQVRLDDTSALMEMYMGECADEVAAAYPDILTMLCVSHTYTASSVPPGIRSESVAGTSVSYAEGPSAALLADATTDVLDELMERVCGPTSEVPGAGTLGASWGGPFRKSETAWMRDVDLWVT